MILVTNIVKLRSRSSPGPFQIYFKSFKSIPIQNQIIWTRSWCYFHCATHHHHHHQETFLEEVKPPNQYRLTSSHDIMIIWWRQVSWTSQDDPLSSQTPTPDFVDRGLLDRENNILGRQLLNKSWSCYEDRCPEQPSSYQDDPLSLQTPTSDFVDGGHLAGENYILGRQVLDEVDCILRRQVPNKLMMQ